MFNVPDTYTSLRHARSAHDRDAHTHGIERLVGARDPLALLERRHDHDRRQAPGRVAAAEVDRQARLRQAHRHRPAGRAAGVVLPDDKWYGTAILNVPIGESIAVTPLQMAALYGAIANGGMWIQPHVTAAIGDTPTTGWKTRQLVSPHVARQLRGMLTDVVDEGTGDAGAHPGLQRGGQDRHDAEVRRQARHLLRSVQGRVRVPDVVRRLRARQEPALRRARHGRRAARQERRHARCSRAASSRPRRSSASPRASCRSCGCAPDRPAAQLNN